MSRSRVSLFISLLLILAACAPHPTESVLPTSTNLQSPLPTPEGPSPTPFSPKEGYGGVTGEIVLPPQWRNATVYIYACPFSGTEEEGFFVLEPSIHPKAIVGPDGRFQMDNVPAGAYVFVVGPTPEQAIPITKDKDRPMVFQVVSGQVLDIGKADLTR